MKENTRVLIVDDQERARRGLKALLATQPELEVVGEATDGEEAVRLAEALRPDVVLMDVRMPNMDGIEATRRIKKAHPEIRVIVLTMYDTHRREALEAGADAFVLKSEGFERLMAAVKSPHGALRVPRSS